MNFKNESTNIDEESDDKKFLLGDINFIKKHNFSICSVINSTINRTILNVKSKRNNKYAIKIQKKSQIQNELVIYKTLNKKQGLNHPNIIQFYGSLKQKDLLYLIIELCNGTLYDITLGHNKRILEESFCMSTILSILNGISYLHSKGICYLDIKSENVLFSFDGAPKISDFGLSKILSESEDNISPCGTTDYVSYEMVCGRQYSLKTDIWSIGVLFYEMLFNKMPFDSHTRRGTYRNIYNVNYNIDSREISNKSKEFLLSTLKKDQDLRSSADELISSFS